MTYDTNAGVYRQWVFSSDGYYHEAEGVWNPTTSLMRWTGKTGNSTFVINDQWISPDRLEWTLERTNEGGNRVQAIAGTLDRAK